MSACELDKLPERFTRRIDVVSSGCWLWTGAKSPGGYGMAWYEGTTTSAHRVIWTLLRGPVPSELPLDHIVCENRDCVNPAHLRVCTHAENVLRSESALAAINARKTHCIHGHPYDEANTRSRPDGGRRCIACNRRDSREYQRRRRSR